MVDIEKIKLENNLEEAIDITQNPNGRFRYMGTYSQIFGATTENQNEIAKIIDLKDKKILVPGSSCDQYISSVFYGSQNETIYDINALAQYYIFLKISALRNLKYDDFIEFIFPFINRTKYLNPDMIKQLSLELPSHIKDFWDIYLGEIDIKNIDNLIKFTDNSIQDIKNRVPYLDEKNYKYLQTLLHKKSYPEFIEADALYFEYSIKDNYDFISLSNIIECNQQPFDDIMERRLYTDEEWVEYIKSVICKNLNPNGELLILKTNELNCRQYEESGFKKHLIASNNPKEKNIALVLKR